ncbi:MAG: DUF5818 domain-containing protein [Acidobacteriota bacterium]|nr:DUF5818 domain-containing protein [Acidobacteriota bacterium]
MMRSKILRFFLFFATGTLCAASYTGVITDQMCGADHKAMGGTSDAKCARDCVKDMGSKYVLANGDKVYVLSDQKSPDKYAGQKVKIEGTLDEKTKTLTVKSISAVK